MSTVSPGSYPQSTAPAGSQPMATAPKKVGSAGYWIALVIFIIGSIVAVVWLVVTIAGVADAPNNFARTSIPSTMRVDIGTGEWVLYYEEPGINDFIGYSTDPSVEVTDPSGNVVDLSYRGIDETYSTGNHDGRAIASFDADQAGVYTVEVSGDGGSSETVAVGRTLWSASLGLNVAGAIALGAVCFLVALVLFIVTMVRRSKSKKAFAAAPYQAAVAGPGAPGSFAAPIPTAPQIPQQPVASGPPPAPGMSGGPAVPPPPGAAPAPGAPYTPGWAAPTEHPAAVPPPPAPSGFTAPGSAAVGSPVPQPPAPEHATTENGAPEPPEDSATNDDWDKPGTF